MENYGVAMSSYSLTVHATWQFVGVPCGTPFAKFSLFGENFRTQQLNHTVSV